MLVSFQAPKKGSLARQTKTGHKTSDPCHPDNQSSGVPIPLCHDGADERYARTVYGGKRASLERHKVFRARSVSHFIAPRTFLEPSSGPSVALWSVALPGLDECLIARTKHERLCFAPIRDKTMVGCRRSRPSVRVFFDRQPQDGRSASPSEFVRSETWCTDR